MNVVAKTRWEYYVANISGILAILGLLGWCIARVVSAGGIDFKSILFWLALLLLIILPFALISFFSSMKAVAAKPTGLVITYVFQKHKNEINFSDVAALKSSKTDKETRVRRRTTRDSFRLILTDGRVFEFDRSQFTHYEQLKSICLRGVRPGRNEGLSSTTVPRNKKRGR